MKNIRRIKADIFSLNVIRYTMKSLKAYLNL